jgi:hypothetical protein
MACSRSGIITNSAWQKQQLMAQQQPPLPQGTFSFVPIRNKPIHKHTSAYVLIQQSDPMAKVLLYACRTCVYSENANDAGDDSAPVVYRNDLLTREQ